MSLNARFEGVCFIRDWPGAAGMLTFWCPPCGTGHSITFGGTETWTWDGNAERPTISPSVLVHPHERSFSVLRLLTDDGPVPPQPLCHSFVRAGRIQYLGDCGHELAGQTIDMVPLPDRYREFLDA